jgi:hypothetical protein
MDPLALLDVLTDPGVYPHDARDLRIHQTHISVVALAGERAYKFKKPVDLGFLDFRGLERRREICAEEVRLNRRMAPGVYLGVAALVEGGEGARRIVPAGVQPEAHERVLEYAVEMRRMNPRDTLAARLSRGELTAADLARVGRWLGEFHQRAERGPAISQAAECGRVGFLHAQNFSQAAGDVGVCVDRALFEQVRDLAAAELTRHAPLLAARAARGVPVDGHGDLRLEHVYMTRDARSGRVELVALDAIEFSDALRHLDPIADLAFAHMELTSARRPELAEALVRGWVSATGDVEGLALIPLYSAYRAVVRAKVDALSARDPAIHETSRALARRLAACRWVVARGLLERAQRGPRLILVAGLPGSGKSTLARTLSAHLGAHLLSSDRIRKRLAGLDPGAGAPAGVGEALYSTQWSDRTYDEIERLTELEVGAGGRVVVDANLREAHRREPLLALADRLGVRATLLVCQAGDEATRARLAMREPGPSDAGWSVYAWARERWEPPAPDPRVDLITLPEAAAADVAYAALERLGGAHACHPDAHGGCPADRVCESLGA